MPTKNFYPGSNTFAPGGIGTQTSLTRDVQVLAADGAITLLGGVVSITKGSIAAITIAAPDQDGQELLITAETAFAHVITCASVGFNGKAASGTATWAAAKGNSIILVSRNGQWYVVSNIGVTIV